MSKITCKIYCHSNSGHLNMIYTGFQLLAKQKKISLSFKVAKHPLPGLPIPSLSELFVNLNGSKILLFDMTDFGEIRTDLLEYTDFYFKRSFSPILVGEKYAYTKIFPLGLHYRIHEKFPSAFSLKRAFLESSPKKVSNALFQNLLGPINSIHPKLFRLHIDNCSAKPNFSLEPGVIFMANLWDPALTKKKYRQQREEINHMRVECVRKLKKTFGSHFMGGLRHNEYTKKNFPDCLLEDPQSAVFGNYMNKLKNYPIGVATTGLHNSIGLKFAEYVAFSHAIVSEKIHYESPGLMVGKHYLEFNSADECVEKVGILMENHHLRHEMMEINHIYYKNYLKPDVLVWRAITKVLNTN